MEHIKVKNPCVSVIIPSYNAQDAIIKALDSLNKQSFRDFEVILVNDGSTDGTDAIIKNNIENYNLKVKYIEQANMGVSQARNTALLNAEGKYITFLDSDDVYHVDFIKLMVNLIEEYKTDTAYCCYGRDLAKVKTVSPNEVGLKEELYSHNRLMQNFMFRIGPCGFFTFIYKSEIIEKKGIYFTKDFKYGEDLEFTWKYLAHCKDGMFIDKKLYGYHNNPSSAMNNVNWRMTDVIDAMFSVENYLKMNKDTYYDEYSNYMVDRSVWAISKDFSIAGKVDLFKKMKSHYEVKKSMKKMIKTSNNKLIKTTAFCYLLSPSLFFIGFFIFAKFKDWIPKDY